jgi:cellulose synthase/poly-beta-1,6-N-acetylglucosamine synthase-like glycosyltransferase
MLMLRRVVALRRRWAAALQLARALPARHLLGKMLRHPGRALRFVLSSNALGDPYASWLERRRLSPARRDEVAAEIAGWSRRPRFSLLMPVFDPPPEYLRAALGSVRAQVYPDWELCVADDASTAPEVGLILAEARAADPRIKVTRLASNRGISAASNAALALATGEFVAPVDHDDTLAPEALYEVARRLQAEPELDFVYTDHDLRDAEGGDGPFFRPDWCPTSASR